MKSNPTTYQAFALSLSVLLLLVFGCGNSTEINNELEGMEYITPPVFEKDSNLYPIYFRTSSTKIPNEKYAAEKALDGNLESYWESIPGNITGEFIEWTWDNQYISEFQIHFSKEIFHAQIINYNVYVNDTLVGTFPANGKFPLNRYSNKIKIEINETPGLNVADIPFENDSLSSTELKKQQIITTYSSKSVAIAEIELFDKVKNKIPFKNIAKVKAFANSISTQKPKEFFSLDLLFDGNLSTEWQSISDPHTILFSFPDDQMITEIILPLQNENETNIQSFKFGLRKREMPVYFPDTKINTIRIPLKQAIKGKNFELIINSTTNKSFPTIAEIIFFDGSKPFRIHTDSTEFYQNALKDSIVNTSLEKLVDNRQRYVKEWNIYEKHLLDIKEAKEPFAPKEYHKSDITFHIRSNKTVYISQSKNDIYYQNTKQPFHFSKVVFEGLWRIISKDRNTSEIELKGILKNYQSDNGFNFTLNNAQKANIRVTLNNQSITFSEHFGPLITSW